MKTFIIDGSNVLHKDSDLRQKMRKDYSIACNSLINRIKAYRSKYPTFKFVIFFDGVSNNKIENSTGINIFFSLVESADKLITSFIDKLANKNNTSLVSSDTELINYARIHSIDIILSDEFLNLIEQNQISATGKSSKSIKSEKPNGCGRKQVKEFLDLFNNAD